MDGSQQDQELYAELASYTLAHRDPEFIHQLAVDAYAAQHATPHTKPIAIAFALAGLYLHIEKGFSGRQVQQAHMRLARRKRQWPAFDLPSDRGSVSVADVLAAAAGGERDAAIERWCASVWQAWGQSRAKVAGWLERELDGAATQPPKRRR